nr:zinc finger, CCHC-type [Tanacetum cinerariifolium]
MAEDASSKKFLVRNKKYAVTLIDDAFRLCYVSLLHTKNEALDKLKVFKTKVKLHQRSLIKRYRTDRRGEYTNALYFHSVGVIHEMTALVLHNKMGEAMLTACYLLNRVPNKRNRITPYKLWTKKKPNLNYLRVWGCRAVVRLSDPKLKTLGERGIECIFVGYAEHSKTFRFYVIEPNNSVLINSIIESKDAIFDENRFSSVPRPSQKSMVKGTEDSNGLVVPEKVTEEVVQKPEPELRKSKKNRTPKDFEPEFQLYLIEGTRDEVSDQHSYCFIIENDPKTFDEAMNSQDVAFWKVATNDEMDSIMGNNTWMLADLPPGCKPLGCKWIFKRKLKVVRIGTIRLLIAITSIHNLIIHQMDIKTPFLNGDLDEEFTFTSKEFLSSMFSMKDMREADVIFGIRIKHESNGIAISQSHYIEKVLKKFNYFDCTPVSTYMDTSEKLMPNNGQIVSQLEYSRVIGCLMYVMTCTRPDIAFVVGKLSSYTSNPGTQHWQAIQRVLKYLKKTIDYRLTYTGYPSVLEGYTDASWINNTEDNSSKSGWVFLLGGGAISWAFKKQSCITGSTMKFEFVALAAADKDTKNITWVKWENILASRQKGGLANGIWRNIVGSINHLHDCCIVPKDTLKYKVGCGTKVRFWIDTWIGDGPLAHRDWKMQWKRPIVFGRINAIWDSLQAELQHSTPFEGQDEILPKKVNIFLWRLNLDRLPHRLNLSWRGLEIQSISCSVCSNDMESNDHGFYTCDVALHIWSLVRIWCDISIPAIVSHSDWKSWFDNLHLSSDGKTRLQVIAATVWWTIWKYKNPVTFNSQCMRKCDLIDNIRLCSFTWLNCRGSKC